MTNKPIPSPHVMKEEQGAAAELRGELNGETCGMTMKQYHRVRFFRLCAAYKEAKKNIHTEAGRAEFIILSVQIHAAKAHVPKRLWSYVNK